MIPGILAAQRAGADEGVDVEAGLNFATGVYRFFGAPLAAADFLSDTARVVDEGLTIFDDFSDLEFTGDVADFIATANFTLVIDFIVHPSRTADDEQFVLLDAFNGIDTDEIYVEVGAMFASIYEINASGTAPLDERFVDEATQLSVGVVNRLAFTRAGDRLSMSVNGLPVNTDTTVLGTSDLVNDTDYALNYDNMNRTRPIGVVTRMEFMSPQTDGNLVVISGSAPDISELDDDTAPTFTSLATASVVDNAKLALPLTTNKDLVEFSIVGGVDSAQFEIVEYILRWSSDGVRDFDAPADANTDNDYLVTVRATDLYGNTTDQTITATVITNVGLAVGAAAGTGLALGVGASGSAGTATGLGSAIGVTPASLAFLARTSGLDSTHINAYTALIDGLEADGIWAKLDMLHIYATQDATTANLNLIGNIYNATPTGSPAFTADLGYTGSASPAKYIATGFTPSTASSPKFVQNSGHVSVWSLTSGVSAGALVMGCTGASLTGIHARFADGNAYFYVNSSGNMAFATASAVGHYIANRSTSSALQGYKDGASVVTSGASTSVTVNSQDILVAGQNQAGSLLGLPYQVAMASIGSSLNSTEAGNFYTRLRTYMTAVGVP